MGRRSSRFAEMMRSSLLLVWGPSGEKRGKFALGTLLPVIILVVITAVVFVIMDSIRNRKTYEDEPVSDVPGEWPIVLIQDAKLDRICFDESGKPLFETCLGIINDSEEPAFNAITQLVIQQIGLNQETQYKFFASVKEAEDKVLKWVGFKEVDCEGCSLPDSYGYFLIFSRNSFNIPYWQVATRNPDSINKLQNLKTPFSKLDYISDDGSGELTIMRFIYKLIGNTPLDPLATTDIEPTTLAVPSSINSGSLASKTSSTFQMSAAVGSLSFSTILLIPLLIASLSLSRVFSFESSITRSVLQAGMHQLPILIAGCTYLLYFAAIFFALTLILWPVFPGTFGSIYANDDFTAGTGVSLILINIFGFLIQASTIMALVPNRVLAIVIVLVLEVFGLGIMTGIQMQDYSWPYVLIAVIIPSTAGMTFPQTISVFKTMAMQSSLFPPPNAPDIITDSSWKFDIYDTFSPNYPNSYLSGILLNSLSAQYKSQFAAVPWIFIGSIISILVHLILLYVGYSMKPREVGGSFHPSHIFLAVPKCKKLRQNVASKFGESPLASPALLSPAASPTEGGGVGALSAKNLSKYYKVPKRTSKKVIAASDRYVKTPRSKCSKKLKTVFAAVNDVSVDFRSREITGLLGVNGAGKSTLLRLLMGLTRPTTGSMEMLGEPILTRKSNILDILPLVGYVPQHNIIGDFSCMMHCCIMASLRGVHGGMKEWRKEAEYALDKVGLGADGDNKVNASAKTLSGGQKRRLMIAMALSGHPPLLILDEPSAGLSLDAKVALNEALQKIRQDSRDETIIITEHDLDQIDELCDRLVILRDGKAVASGTSLTLKEEHGNGFTLRVSFDEMTTRRQEDKERKKREGNKSDTSGEYLDGNSTDEVVGTVTEKIMTKLEADSSTIDVETLLEVPDMISEPVSVRTDKLIEILRGYDPGAYVRFSSGRDVFFQMTDEVKDEMANVCRAIESMKRSVGIRSFSIDITTLSDVFINISEGKTKEQNKKQEDTLVTASSRPPVVSEHKIISYNTSFNCLAKKSFKSFWKSIHVSLKFIGDIVLGIVLLALFTNFAPNIVGFLESSTTPISLSNESGMSMGITATTVLSKLRWTYDPTSLSGQHEEIKRVMEGIGVEGATEFPFSGLQGQLNLDRTRSPLPGSILDTYTGNLGSSIGTPVIVWNTADNISVYLPPEYYIETFNGNISSISILDPTIIGVVIDRAKQGYTTGSKNSVLFSVYQSMKTEPVRSFYGDPRRFVLPVMSMFIPFYSIMVCITLTSMAVVIPFLLTRERVSGFAMLLRLAGEKRFSNVLTWMACVMTPCTLISVIVVILCEFLPLLRIQNIEGAPEVDWPRVWSFIGISVITSITCSANWALLGIWISYRFKAAERALKAAPLLLCLLLIPLIVIMSVMALTTGDMTFSGIDNIWKILQWVFGIFPFSISPVLMIGVFFYSFLPVIFSLNYEILIPCLVVNIVFLAFFAAVVFIREGVECGYFHSPPLAKSFVKFLTIGRRATIDVPGPSDKVRKQLGCPKDTSVIVAEDRHPQEDETVEAERRVVRDGDAKDSIVQFKGCRREFCFSSKGKEKNILLAVRNLDLGVRRGECLGLVGENGAGKTTALSMAIGTLAPSFGSAKVYARKLGYVPQFDAHCSCITVSEHVDVFATLSGIDLCKAKEIAHFVGLKPHMKKYPSQLSGGYKRRLSLALALITSSELLIADEVAAGVDERARCDIIGMIDSLKEAGCTILITSHNMETVDRITTRVAMLTKGYLRSVDTPNSLKQQYSSGLTVVMQLAPNSTDVAHEWLAEQTSVEKEDILVLPSLGGDCRYVIPKSSSVSFMRMLEILKPSTRPEWILRSSVSESSLESVFLSFEKETKDIGLNNLVTPNTYLSAKN